MPQADPRRKRALVPPMKTPAIGPIGKAALAGSSAISSGHPASPQGVATSKLLRVVVVIAVVMMVGSAILTTDAS